MKNPAQHPLSARAFRPARRFTLVEMLVVIAIIGILAALLLPALQNALNSARIINCANNFKNMGVVVSTYANDNNAWLPSYNANIWYRVDTNKTNTTVWNFFLVLKPYLTAETANVRGAPWGKVFYCPVATTSSYATQFAFDGNARISYFFEYLSPPFWRTAPIPMRRITTLTPPPYGGFSYPNHRIAQDMTMKPGAPTASGHLNLGWVDPGYADPRDNGNFLYTDGSVKHLMRGQSGFISTSYGE